MKIPEVKKLVDDYSMDELIAAEHALVNDVALPIIIDGEDEGEKLTHILAAIFILERMKSDGLEFSTALKDYTRRVRESIT